MASTDGTEAFLRLVMEKLTQFNTDLTEYTNNESVFSSEVASELRKMKTVLTTTMSKLGQDFDRITGAQDPILQLLTLRNLEMTFDFVNSLQLFRSQVASLEPTIEEQDSILKRHLFPVYLSSLPALLSDTFPGPGEGRDQAVIPSKDAALHSTLNLDIFFIDPKYPEGGQVVPRSFGVRENVHEILCDMIPRMLLNHLHPDFAAFKVTGLNEYIYGNHSFNEFLSVREAVHNQTRLQVELCSLESPDAHRVYISRIFTFWRDLRQEFYRHAGLVLDGTALSDAIQDLENAKPDLLRHDSVGEIPAELRRLNSLEQREQGSEEERHAVSDHFMGELGPLQSGRGRGRGDSCDDDDDGFTGRYSRGRSVSRAPPGHLFQQQLQQQQDKQHQAYRDSRDSFDDNQDQFTSPLPNNPLKLSARGRANDRSEDSSDLSRFRGQSIAPGAGGDTDDGGLVLRPLATCKPIDFGVKNNTTGGGVDAQDHFDMDAVQVKKLGAFTTPQRQQEWDLDDDDRYSKRASGVINVPSNILLNSESNPTKRSGFGSLNFGALRSSQAITRQDSDDDDFGVPRATQGPTSMFSASGSSFTSFNNNNNNTNTVLSRDRAGSGFIPFNPAGFGSPAAPASSGSGFGTPHTPNMPSSTTLPSPASTPLQFQSQPLPLLPSESDSNSAGDYKGTPYSPHYVPPASPLGGAGFNFRGPMTPSHSAGSTPVVDLKARGRGGGTSYKTLRRGSMTKDRDSSQDRRTTSSNDTSSNTPQPQVQVAALDISAELRMNKDITQRRRRSIVNEIALNDSDEEDFGVTTQKRSPSDSHSHASQLVHSTTPTHAMVVAAGQNSDGSQIFNTVANLRDARPAGSQRNLMSALGDINSDRDEIDENKKVESKFQEFANQRGLERASPPSAQATLSASPEDQSSPSRNNNTTARRTSVLTPSKNALFKFSTLTAGDAQNIAANSPTTPQLGAFAEDLDTVNNYGQLFIPALHPSLLQQLGEDEVLLSLDLKCEKLNFDQVAKHHRILATSLVVDNSGPAPPQPTDKNTPDGTNPAQRPTHHRCAALPLLKDNSVFNDSTLTIYNSLSQSQPELTYLIERPDPLLFANTKPAAPDAPQPKPPSAAQIQRQKEMNRQIAQLAQRPVLDLATPTQGFALPFFTVAVHGVDGLSVETCPRLGSIPRGTGERSKLSIVTCILANNTLQRGSLSQTTYIDTNLAPRWGQTVLPHPNPTNEPSLRGFGYGVISRHSKIGFILVESIPSENPLKEQSRHVPLAWVSMPVFQETDMCLQGVHNLALWPLSNTEGDLDLLGASQHLIDQYHANGGKIPKIVDKKAAKKDDKKGGVALEKSQLGFSTIVNDFDVRECPFVYRGTNSPNMLQVSPAILTVQFASFNAVVLNTADSMNVGHYDHYDLSKFPPMKDITKLKLLTKEQRLHYDVVVAADMLHTLSEQEKEIVWLVRDQFSKDNPQLLPLFLQCVNWSNPHHRNEALRTLESWPKLTTFPQVIALLDQPVTDYRVRSYAVKCLREFADQDLSTLQLFLLQLTQCLKFEPYHFSPLAEFLLERSFDNPFQIGHFFYWGLKNEMCFDPPFTPRYRSILEAFISFCPSATDSMRTQQHIIDECSRLATKIRQLKTDGMPLAEYNAIYKQALTNLNRDYFNRLPGGVFQIPLDPRWEATKLLPDKCRIMSSKMVPLWLTFENADKNGKPFFVMFKAGDDLRQDILTLQILRFLDQIWLKNGMDLCLSPYNVLATGKTEQGKGCGMIQIVLNSTTTSAIHTDYGGGASGAFKEDTIWQFLCENNKTKEELDKAVDNFVRSCAGYCVATYVLGIGDRHNGNIMVTNDGHLFHIDFGHFLGNFKSKFGMNRERSAFVFTSEMVYAMGGSSKISSSKHHFKRFEDYCLRAIDLVRQHANELETLFLTMIGAGMPELIKTSDILYIREKLCLNKTAQATRELFKQELKVSMNCTSRTWDNFMHNLKHAGK